ncbi:MAG: polysaccharide deacetylase family protein [Methanoculleus sp.]|jgi:peptidoglycan/xylan/chitin deacetylase (PgdA/CDA1 family)|nr:polysaccharide deacetylase family protein [Candidatus Methanomethylophilaceae archaeon]MDD3932237.1 polysaccharide deacetylase family protein [Methanoculleus sp.]
MGIDTGAAGHIPDSHTEERPKRITMVARDNMLTLDLAQRNPELWDLFTGKEEYSPEVVDRFGRIQSNAGGNQNLIEPLVSRYLIERECKFEYPDGRPFAICLTHDIDHLYQPLLEKGLATAVAIRDRNFRKALQMILQFHNKRHPWCNLRAITEIEEHYGARSSFFIQALDPDDQDYTYDVSDLESELGEIADESWEIGLHGGYMASTGLEGLVNDKQRLERILGKPVVGYRAHSLRFKVPDTWELLAEAGFRYDTTYGYADHVGFRNGMCHPFQPFNLNTGQFVDIMELPLVFMDRTCLTYMQLDARATYDLAVRLIDAVAACHGVLTLLWHNTTMDGALLGVYEKILQYCSDSGAWMTSGDEISSWWQKLGAGPSSQEKPLIPGN